MNAEFGHEQGAALNRSVPPRMGGRRPRRRAAPRPFLATTGCFLDGDDLRADSVVMAVIADDIAWRFSLLDWESRRPPRWAVGRTRRWREEYALLADQRAHVASTARFFGVSD